MRSLMLTTALLVALGAPAIAGDYPVSGRWGVSTGADKGAIDCTGKRVIAFDGDQRSDSGGGVPVYRNVSVTPAGQARYRIVDEFSSGQISAARVYYTLVETNADRIELQMQQGGTLKLRKCK